MRQKVSVPATEWAPDTGIMSGLMAEAKGCVFLSGRYAPFLAPAPIKPTGTMGAALGAQGFYDAAGNVWVFLGDDGDLYTIKNRAPFNVSRIGAYPDDTTGCWVFEQFGGFVYAARRGQPIQMYELGVSSRFADLTAGPLSVDTIFRVREYMFAGYGRTLYNSAFNAPQFWTPGDVNNVGAAQFDLPADGGNIITGVGGQFAIIFQERKIHRLTFTGAADAPFQRDEIEDKRGALGANAVTRYGDGAFFASEDGIRFTDGAGNSVPVGAGKVDRYFASRLNYSRRSAISLAFDAARRLLIVAFPASSSLTPSEALIYSFDDKQWTHADVALSLVFEAPKQGISLDDADAITALVGTTNIDLINISVDSPIWRESRRQWMCVNSSGQICTFEGSPVEAVIETGFIEAAPGRKAYVSELWPETDAPTITGAITTKFATLADAAINGSAVTMSSHGLCAVRHEARYIAARFVIPNATSWTEFRGFKWDAEARGER